MPTVPNPPRATSTSRPEGIDAERTTIAYWRIGERSSVAWFALYELLGYEDAVNFDGSWTEWGNLVDAPIETGAE